MNSILEEFACVDINPEPRFFERGSHYGRTMQKISGNEERLLATLNGNGKEDLIVEGDSHE